VTGYLDLDDEEQAEALRPVAVEAAAGFGLGVGRLDVHTHSYNTTYSLVTPGGERFALRIGTNSTSVPAEVVAQQEWQVAIATDTDIVVPRPLRTVDGGWVAAVPSEALGREVLVTCATWLEGQDVGAPDEQVAAELGRTMALLHRHARSWPMPDGARLPLLDSPLLGDEERLSRAPGLTSEQRRVLDGATRAAERAFADAFATEPAVVLHADLHGNNLKWHEGRLAVFDFDDCGLGVPALDLAISAFYLRSEDASTEEALLSGYASVSPLPHVRTEVFEGLLASRQLLLANDLLGSTTAQWRGQSSDYLRVSVDRLRAWLDTGRFSRVVPGS
jgi:Ser/Thr protein kinase RdoA (MazF antagonist)